MNESTADILANIAKKRTLAQQIWNEGFGLYLGVPLALTPSYRSNMDVSRFDANAALIFGRIKDSIPLLRVFPGLNIKFEDKTIRTKMVDETVRTSLPEFLYDDKTKTLYATTKAIAAEGVFAHELGHHIHGYFTDKDHETLLRHQRWQIREPSGSRPATIVDIKVKNNLDSDEFGPNWVLLDLDGNELRKRYRHSNPWEMVADTVWDNWDDLLKFADTGTPTQEEVINFLLNRLPTH